MNPFAAIRRQATACRRKAEEAVPGVGTAGIIAAALDADDLELHRFDRGVRFHADVHGLLQPTAGLVFVARGLDPDEEAFVVAHEIGHFHLHRDPSLQTKLTPTDGPSTPQGTAGVAGYSRQELKEAQADAFAAEFLCPTAWLRAEVVVNRRTPDGIARDRGIPRRMVRAQAVRALLLPPARPEAPDRVHEPAWDPHQRRAIEWDGRALVVKGGPGTGKTRIMAARIRHLVGRGERAASILALLPSEAAAEAMRSLVGPTIASEAWIGTFAALGRELALKWPAAIGRTKAVRILDRAAALDVLAGCGVPGIGGRLAETFQRIIRFKHGLADDDGLATTALPASADGTDGVAAPAGYDAYQRALEREDALDAADLVPAALSLLRSAPEKGSAYAGRFGHVLVDALEDAGPVARSVLEALHGLGLSLWATGDEQQAIDRLLPGEDGGFAGFASRLPCSCMKLVGNKRAGPRLSKALDGLAAIGPHGGRWKRAALLRGGSIRTTAAGDAEGEASAIRNEIEALRRQGFAYSEQVIIARRHSALARIVAPLTRLGVPLLHAGDLAARAEVKALLAVATGGGFGDDGAFKWIACNAPYRVPGSQAEAFVRWAKDRRLGPCSALRLLPLPRDEPFSGSEGLARLGRELAATGPTASPYDTLCAWLFEDSEYLAPLLTHPDAPEATGRLLAIYHLVKLCEENEALGGDAASLDYRVRRAGSIDQVTAYRSLAQDAAGVDAVRVMTIHASKGSEFRAVHLVEPPPRRDRSGQRPKAWKGRDPAAGWNPVLEDRLFRIAVTRVRQHLHLVRCVSR